MDAGGSLGQRRRSASRANRTRVAHSCASSAGSAPSPAAVATSSAAQRTSNMRSIAASASAAVRIVESAAIVVPLTADRCSYAR